MEKFRWNDGSEVQVLFRSGEPWFVGEDVANLLGYINPAKAIYELCKDATPIGANEFAIDPEIIIISERDLLRLALQSKTPLGEAFQEWVVGTILPLQGLNRLLS